MVPREPTTLPPKGEQRGSGGRAQPREEQERGTRGWRFAGRVGSGIAGRAATQLANVLAPLTIPSSPFSDEVPRFDSAGATSGALPNTGGPQTALIVGGVALVAVGGTVLVVSRRRANA